MGKKVSPHAFRLGITRTWDSIWYAKKNYKKFFLQDISIRNCLAGKLKDCEISKFLIERQNEKIKVAVYTAKPGMVVGRGGEKVLALQKDLENTYCDKFEINVQEIQKPEASASLVAQSIAKQIMKRFPYRRVAKMALDKAKEAGVKGIKILISGRLNGVDIARKENYSVGTVPLHTLRADIDYSLARAETTYGTIGVKVWIYNGLVFKNTSINK